MRFFGLSCWWCRKKRKSWQKEKNGVVVVRLRLGVVGVVGWCIYRGLVMIEQLRPISVLFLCGLKNDLIILLKLKPKSI